MAESKGSFSKLGLSKGVVRGVMLAGHRLPTPVQRKVIPPLIEGNDVITVARTGSGKSAAFLLPLLHRLGIHSDEGPRALVLSPTRDLAIQTLRFAKTYSRFTGLKLSLIVGGDSFDKHFSAMHSQPDIIFATPGRFLHIVQEMSAKLNFIQVLVLDEADRLFELGFSEDLYHLLNILPSKRQTVCLSATLPEKLIEFSKAGLRNPQLIRTAINYQLNPNLKTVYLYTRTELDKLATLLYLLQSHIPKEEKSVVFTATKYHVEFISKLLDMADIPCSISYSTMDNEARLSNLDRFRKGQVNLMIVTDIAARGLDIPFLNNVINFSFPSSPKLFVHRVGRVARMDFTGTAYSLFTSKELPYVIDLHEFIMQEMKTVSESGDGLETSGIIGAVPLTCCLPYNEFVNSSLSNDQDLVEMQKKMHLGEKKSLKFSSSASLGSAKKAKAIDLAKLEFHPIFPKTESDTVSRNMLFADHIRSTKYVTPELKSVMTAGQYMENLTQKLKRERSFKERPTKRVKSFLDSVAVKKTQSKFSDPDFHKVADVAASKIDLLSEFDKEAVSAALNFDDDNAGEKDAKPVWDRKKNRYIRKNNNENKKKSYMEQKNKSKLYDAWKKKMEKKSNMQTAFPLKGVSKTKSCQDGVDFVSNQLAKKRIKRKQINKNRKRKR